MLDLQRLEFRIPDGLTKAPSKSRAVTKARRRRQLIESTIESIAKRGFSETTLANVADGAGLSRGIVNFHFRSKEALLVETLRYIAEEFREVWNRALAKAGPSAAERLAALVEADFEPVVCSRKRIAVWFAFWGEAKSRPRYLEICGESDREYGQALRDLCLRIVEEGGYRDLDPVLAADGLSAMSDGLWQDLLLNPQSFDRQAAKRTCFAYLAAIFPRHFSLERTNAAREA